MATLEVIVKYRPPLARLGRVLTWCSVFFWGLCPLALVLGVILRIYVPFSESSGDSLSGALFMAFPSVVMGIFFALLFGDNKLILSRQGICFPKGFLLPLYFRRNRPWHDLRSVQFHRPIIGTNVRNDRVTLNFRSGGWTTLHLNDMRPDEVEQLFLAIETFAAGCAGQIEIEQNRRLLAAGLQEKGIKSYTNLWEDELRYCYSSTTFIPLSPGRYMNNDELKIVRQLGFGGLSAIYLAQKGGRDLVVLKESVVPPDADSELAGKAVELFEREARILAKLKHPNIARVQDYFVEEGRHYLVLDYIHGQDLRQLVKEKGLPSEADVIRYARQIASLLAYLHEQQPPVIHRDITPENLVLNDRGQIVLIDFGAANEFLQTATGTLVGKHAYISPEQFKGKATVQSDLYAFGATLHFLLTGEDPVALSQSRPDSVNPQLSSGLCRVVEALTAIDCTKRTASARIALSELSELLEPSVVPVSE